MTVPPLGIVAGLTVAAFVVGGLLGTLMKFQLGIEAVAAFFLVALVITAIATALKPAIGWIGIFPTAILAGLLVFTAAFVA